MHQKQLIHKIAEQVNLSKIQVEAMLAALVETIYQETKDGGQVKLPKLGTFKTKKSKARLVYNPDNHLTYVLQENIMPEFKPTQVFKDYIAKKTL